MAHCFNTNSNIPFSWAGQAADDPFGQKWLPNSDLSAPPTGRAGLLSTDAPRNDESLIKDFNDELPDHDAQEDALGQSSWLLINGALSDHTDLPFDLVIDNDIELDAARPVSYEIARTSSQASSTGIDEESIGFSNADDLYDIGFSAGCGDDILNGINSPGTSFSDVNLSTNPSLENSPVSPRCPFLSMQAGNSGSDISSRNATSAPQSYIAANANSSFPDFGSARTPRSAPRHNVSALSTELAGQSQYQAIDSSPSSEYFERWSSRAGDDGMESVDLAMWDDSSLSENFVPYIQSQLGPSFVIVPPETPDALRNTSHRLLPLGKLRSHPTDGTPKRTQYANPASFYNEHTESPLGPSPPTSSDVGPGPYERSLESAFISFSAPTDNERRGLYVASGKSCSERQGPNLLTVREYSVSAGATDRANEDLRGYASHAYCLSPWEVEQHRPIPRQSDDDGSAWSAGTCAKMVCIRCKHSKQKCKRDDDSLDGSCIGCDRHGGSQRWPGPCVKAHFEDLVLSGSCNYVSSHAIYHPTLDHATRIRRELPKQIHLDELMARLDRARLQFNFKVHQDGQPLYVLDLDSCHEYLQGLRQQMDSAEYSFPTFIDREILRIDTRNDDWERCMTQTTTPWGDWLSLLCDVNKMPSRASFSYVSKPYYTAPGAGVEQPINVEDPNEADNLMLAAQLSRIICRKLEVKAYQHLQRLLHESGTMEDDKVLPFLQSLGRILLTLRWRLSWWTAVPEVVGMSDQDEDAGRRQVELRVHALCRVLYFYYCCVRRRPSVWPNLKALSGIHSKYPDTETEVWDDFPGDESVEGFGAWMDRGRELVVEAGVVNRLRSMGLAA
ncbi:hypothetical protein CSPAE12_05135 [Colletotrichum incanum]|nr:hypothetical protein CSPAE12_05135 [Colletotrichum incanum]